MPSVDQIGMLLGIMPKVHIESGEYRRKVLRSVVEALGDEFVDRCKKATMILIKPNVIHHELQLASTHVDALRGVLDVIRVHTGTPVVIADAGFHGTAAGFRHFGYERLPEEYTKVFLKDLNDDAHVDATIPRADGSTMPIRRAKTAYDADFTISLTPMKTHGGCVASLAIENWAHGTWVVPPRIGAHGMVWSRQPWLEEAHHEVLAHLFKERPCDVAVIDGILAMEGAGPVRGTAVPMNLALAGFDAVAVDSVAASLMNLDPHAIPYLEMCVQAGLGVNEMSKIDVPLGLVLEHTRKFITA